MLYSSKWQLQSENNEFLLCFEESSEELEKTWLRRTCRSSLHLNRKGTLGAGADGLEDILLTHHIQGYFSEKSPGESYLA